MASGRLIPAHAGKTTICFSESILTRAHPRSRGENLSPRPVRVGVFGLIPAHAGKTTAESM